MLDTGADATHWAQQIRLNAPSMSSLIELSASNKLQEPNKDTLELRS